MKRTVLICSVLLCSAAFALAAAPTVSSPAFSNLGANQVTLTLRSDATGTGYFTLLAGGGAAPGTGAQTQAGLDSTGASAFRRGSLTLTAGTDGSYTVRNLTANTAYTVCFTADDGATLQPTCATASFTTTAATDLTGGVWVNAGAQAFTPGGAGELSLAFSPQGAPGLAFRDLGSGDKASMMALSGGTWAFVGSAGFSPSIPNDCTVVYSPDGHPYVAYADYANGNRATVMRFNGTGWTSVGAADFTAGSAGDVSLAISPDGLPWVAFNESANSFKLCVMSFDGTNWNVVASSLSDGSAGDIKLAFAPDGTPYVAFRDDYRSSRASVLKYQGGVWSNVGAAGFVGGTSGAYYLSLAFAPDGTPHLAFCDFSNAAKACVMRFDGAAWVSVGATDFSPSSATYLSLAFAPDGQPWVAFRDQISGSYCATVMAFDGASWSVRGSRGVSGGGVAEVPLAFSPEGVPHVAFSDTPNSGRASVKKLQIPVPPVVTSVDVPAAGTYATGQNLDFTVHLSAPVIFTMVPQIRLTIGSTTRYATYSAGYGSDALVFRYAVQGTDNGSITVGPTILLNTGTMTSMVDGSDTNVALNNVASTAGITVGATLTTPTITWAAPAAITYGTALSATQLNATATVSGTPVAGTFVYTPTAGTLLNAGAGQTLSVAFTPTDTATYNGATATTTLTVDPATAAVSLSNLSATYNGSAHAATVTTTPVGLATTVTYGGSGTAPTAAGSYAVVATIANSNYSGSASGTLVISKAGQTITFGALASRVVSDPSFTLGASASSGLTVTYASSNLSVATVSGGTVTIVGVGSSDITASQAGNLNFNAAPDVVQVLTVTSSVAGPSITKAPTSQQVAEGDRVSLSVTATGAGLFYQWRKNGVDIVGAWSSQLTIFHVTPGDAGSYTVRVTNAGGSVESTAAVLTVQAHIVAPAITTQPGAQLVPFGGTATLTVVASGTAPLGYQWYQNDVAVAGATSATLTLHPVRPASTGNYAVVVSNAAGTVRSNSAALTVSPRGLAGAYFGTFGADDSHHGTFALYVRDDGTGVFLAYEASGQLAFVVRNVQLDATRRFRFTMNPANPLVTTVTGADGGAAVVDTTVDAAIAADGSISGKLSGATIAALDAGSPPIVETPADVAGFYEAGVAGSSSCSYFIVNAAREAYVLTVHAGQADMATGTVGSAGAFSFTSDNHTCIDGTIDCRTATLTTTVTGAGTNGGSATCRGGNAETRADVEKMINVSGRGVVSGSDALIAGFVVNGTEPKRVLVRAVGPSLTALGVTNALLAARLEVFHGSTSIAVGNDWGDGANATELTTVAHRVGAFPLSNASHDAALLLSLPPGTYSAVVTGQGGATGIAVVEVYDASEASVRTERIINVSSRANIGPGEAALFSGFVIDGSVPKRVLIRGVGPTLAQLGVANSLPRPEITVWSGQTILARNAGWTTGVDAAAIATAGTEANAFPLSSSGGDAALIIYLNPGCYCVQVTGRDGSAGVALAEVYELP